MTPNITNSSALSIRDTNALKGFALLLLLCHHLFFVQNGLFDDIHIIKSVYLAQELGVFCKLCVVMFVFLSGYGLMAQAEIKGGVSNLKEWYIRRFKKLMLNYWVIWIVFVPISYFFFNMSFEKAYQHNVFLQTILDFFGIHELIYTDSIPCFNPTWWFYSCIILLYLLFPLMHRMMKKDALYVVLLTLIISFLPIPFIDVIKFNIVAFSLGMWMANIKNAPPRQSLWIVLLLALLYAVERNVNSYPLMIDCVLALLIVRLYQSVKKPKVVLDVMEFLGEHSMNIFLFHTFIFYFWFQDFVYASRNPVIIFLTLLAICLPISIALELVKKYTIYKL